MGGKLSLTGQTTDFKEYCREREEAFAAQSPKRANHKFRRIPVERPSGWKHAENRVAPKRHRESVLWQEEYADYLTSADWKRRSGEYRAKHKKCAICKAKRRTKGFDVHHVHYRTLGYETYEDLRLVCRRCHIAIHTWQHAAKVTIEQATHDVWMQHATWGVKVLTPDRIRKYAKRKLAGTSAGN